MTNEIDIAVRYMHDCAKVPMITETHAKNVFKIIRQYLSEFQRSQKFRGLEIKLSPRFRELLSFFGKEEGVTFTSQFYLFCYTLTENYKEVQIPIHDNIATPFKVWVKNSWVSITSSVKNIPQGYDYVFICRHAVTQGAYAPGKSIFTFAKALLEADRAVTIVCLGKTSDEFVGLSKSFPKLRIFGLRNTSNIQGVTSLVELLHIIQPKTILTEIEFDIVSILSIIGPRFPVIYLSPGFYNLPWYDKIGLTDTLTDDIIGNRVDDIFEIPTYVCNAILNPPVAIEKINSVKKALGFTTNDFVIGSFARMEKFQRPFLRVLENILNQCPNTKVVLAGSNDQSIVKRSLEKYIRLRRAFVFPNVDVHTLGHCIDLGVDTFPTHSGFSVLEMMAKGIPVVAKKEADNHTNWSQRIPDLMRETDDSLVELVKTLVVNPDKHSEFCNLTKSFLVSETYDETFIAALDNAVHT